MQHEQTKHQRTCSGFRNLLAIMQQLTIAVMVGILVLPMNSPAQDIPAPFTSLSQEIVAALATLPREGDLDTSFSGDGLVITDFAGRGDTANAIAIQPDGKIVVAGGSFSLTTNSGGFALARYLPNGALGTSFSGDGKVRIRFAINGFATALAIQPDGKIVVVGNFFDIHGDHFAMVRYVPNGTLDASFNEQGWVTNSNLGSSAGSFAVALQPDGKIVVAGNSFGDFAVARYLSNGTLDKTFNGVGLMITDLGAADEATALALQPDGKIVVAGASGPDFAVARYLSNGTLDTTFSGNGWVITDLGSSGDIAHSVALQRDGKIVVAGFPGLARYRTNGTLDPSFGGDGTVLAEFSEPLTLALQPDGKIVVAGTANAGNDGYAALSRYLPSGTLDATFQGGTVLTNFGLSNQNRAHTLAIQPRDGRLVIAGSTINGVGPAFDFALARYHAITCNGVGVTRVGTAGNDTIIGTSGDDVIYGFGGNDFIDGRGGNDILCGGSGNDTLVGGSGDDILSGGAGTDICRGDSHVFGDKASQCETVTTVP